MSQLVDQDVAHDLCGDGKEVAAILPCDFLLPAQPQIRFVNQRGSAQRLAISFSLYITMGDAPQLVIDQRSQLIKSGLVTLLPVSQQFG